MTNISAAAAAVTPPLADYPTATIRSTLPPEEWQACLDSWLFSLGIRLRLSEHDFKYSTSPESPDLNFLSTYCNNQPLEPRGMLSGKEAQLHRRVYLLFRRLLLETSISHQWEARLMIEYLLLADQAFHPIPDWRATLHELWEKESSQLSFGLESWKTSMLTSFQAPRGPSAVSIDLRRMNSLVQTLPEAGVALMTGSDYLESIMSAYNLEAEVPRNAKNMDRILTEHLYRSLRSLLSDNTKHISLLLDHLYFLKTEPEKTLNVKAPQRKNILSSLLCTTNFLAHLSRDVSVLDTKRGRGEIESLTAYREQTKHLHPPAPVPNSRATKGKGKARDHEEVYIHKEAQISQIHELFPTLSNAYILQLLDHYENEVERVIAALLEPDALPSHLRESTADASANDIESMPNLAPRSTPSLPLQRKNVFDDDQFDRLKISPSQIHRGRKEESLRDDSTREEHARSKAAIMAALAVFDSDDDERDDTYDVADVGGTVDQSMDTDSRPRRDQGPEQNPHEELLFRAWKDNHEMFARESKTRVSPARQDLKRQTGLSDEQIEGWAVVLGRDKALQARLQKKYSDAAMIDGGQRTLDRTRWLQNSSRDASADESEGVASDRPNDGRRMGQAQIRGNRNWGRGRGGSTAGPTDDPKTQAARRRKEQGRGRGGGQNRREGRARKMGRGMAGPTG